MVENVGVSREKVGNIPAKCSVGRALRRVHVVALETHHLCERLIKRRQDRKSLTVWMSFMVEKNVVTEVRWRWLAEPRSLEAAPCSSSSRAERLASIASRMRSRFSMNSKTDHSPSRPPMCEANGRGERQALRI